MNKEEAVVYFAYGSNMDMQNLEKLKVKVIQVERAILKNHSLIFNVINEYIPGAGYANIIPQESSSVEGIIIYTDKNSIQNLDKYEGFPYLYHKKYLTVLDCHDQCQEALVYTGNPSRTKCGLKPSEAHLNHILEGKDYLTEHYWSRLSKTEFISDKYYI